MSDLTIPACRLEAMGCLSMAIVLCSHTLGRLYAGKFASLVGEIVIAEGGQKYRYNGFGM